MLYTVHKKKKHYQYELKEIECFIVDLPDVEIIKADGSVFLYITLLGGVLTIQTCYKWDGSSIPLKKWWKWIFDSDKYCKIASLCHDALYQLMKLGLLSVEFKRYIDEKYEEDCVKGGMGKKQAARRAWCLSKKKIKIVTAEEQEILEVLNGS